ncbi:MAG: urocanate hydratase, partial [Candidatus Neomarinimicrobiota bacterium]
IGRAINGGFGLLLDGKTETDDIIKNALSWDVMGGVARRSWARNPNAVATAEKWNSEHIGEGQITLPFEAEESMLEKIVANKI